MVVGAGLQHAVAKEPVAVVVTAVDRFGNVQRASSHRIAAALIAAGDGRFVQWRQVETKVLC